jgi:hypothetical protein
MEQTPSVVRVALICLQVTLSLFFLTSSHGPHEPTQPILYSAVIEIVGNIVHPLHTLFIIFQVLVDIGDLQACLKRIGVQARNFVETLKCLVIIFPPRKV